MKQIKLIYFTKKTLKTQIFRKIPETPPRRRKIIKFRRKEIVAF